MVLITQLLPGSSSSSSTHHHDHNHPPHPPVYDVFLSFRGADTRDSFTDHLHKALKEADIKTFYDDTEIENGEQLKPELDSSIKSSRASIIVLSENYAFSKWCLDELVLILKQEKNNNQIVVPIFYHVEPTDIRNQKGSFGKAMENYKVMRDAETDAKKRSEWDKKMELWKGALEEIGKSKGQVAKGRKETKLIREIVVNIHRRLGVPLGYSPSHLIGMEYYIDFISSWLTDGSCHTADILTIVGIGGIGKTLLTEHVFKLHSVKFHKSDFIKDINETCKQQFNGLRVLKNQLDRVISKKVPLRVNDVSKKVFIVLDDIGSLDQLDGLLGNQGLYPGSKIIITTKFASLTEKCVLFDPAVQPKHQEVSLKGLHESASLELLCTHAFKSNQPKEGYEDVSKELVKYCDGHPLALTVLGSSLRKQDVGYWEYSIKELKKEPHPKIRRALQMSIDHLPFANDKELFKHIACFFVGNDRDLTETILNACGIDTKYGIMNLIHRCLLRIEGNNELVMHSLIQEVGKDLVRQESPKKPWKRSRLWCHEESFMVLKRKNVTKSTQGLALDMRMLDKKKLRELETDSLSNMDNLMLLQLNYAQLNGCFENFPEDLRWLCMHGFPLTSIHLDSPMDSLVVLDMSCSNIESFDMSYSYLQPLAKRQKGLIGSSSRHKRLLGSLKILDLSFCQQLRYVGGFSRLPALERLLVGNCISLIEVCESVDQCVELVHIDLSYCYKLKEIPKSIGNLKKVSTLLLDGCDACESQIETIPSAFKFSASFLPSSLTRLSLADSNFYNESFPMDLSQLSMLEELCLDCNPIVRMPECVRTLPRLQRLHMDNCEMLTSIMYPPRSLRYLTMVMYNSNRDFWPLLRELKFDREMSPLTIYGAERPLSHLSSEIDGMIKIQALVDVEEKVLHSLGWPNLDLFKERRLGTYICGELPIECQTQMYYEFGIFSILYEGREIPDWIKDRSKGPSISYTIPPSPNNVRGLNFWYTGETHPQSPIRLPFIEIRNVTRNQAWVYNHYIYGVVFVADLTSPTDLGSKGLSLLSHWMFGPNEMKGGDEIAISVYALEGQIRDDGEKLLMECGISIVYDDDDGKADEGQEDALKYYKSWNHIIGGDLSAFQLTTGHYILHNSQFMRDTTSTWSDCIYYIDGSSYKEEKVSFKAFSRKTFEIAGHEDLTRHSTRAGLSHDRMMRYKLFLVTPKFDRLSF